VPPGKSRSFTGSTAEELVVEHSVHEHLDIYADGHQWLSPALPYSVELSAPEEFEGSVCERLGVREIAMEGEPVSDKKHALCFSHPYAAFSLQGFVWSFSRKSRYVPKAAESEIRREPQIAFNTVIHKMQDSTIQQAGPHSTQAYSATYAQQDFDDLKRALNVLTRNFEQLGLDPRLVNIAKAQITTLNAQLSDNPNPVIVKEAGKTLRNVTEGVIAGLITSAAEQPGVWQSVHDVLQRLFS
jgi:hypothetical protein